MRIVICAITWANHYVPISTLYKKFKFLFIHQYKKCKLTKLGNTARDEFADKDKFSFLAGGGEWSLDV